MQVFLIRILSFAFALQRKSTNKKLDSKASKSAKRSSSIHPHINNLNENSERIFHLQRTIGDHALQKLVHSDDNVKGFDFPKIGIQPQLKISQPEDAYEQEADKVAEQIMKVSSSVHSSSPASLATTKGEEELDRKCAACEMKQKEDAKQLNISRKPSTSSNLGVNDEIEKDVGNIHSTTATPLDPSTREFMESSFGYDFSKVRIHTDELASRSARSVNALAYTFRNDVAFAGGQYQPNTVEGRRVLAHELVHVIQQGEAPIKMNRASQFGSPSDAAREGDTLTTSNLQGSSPNSMTVSRVPNQVLQRQEMRPIASGAPIFEQVIDADRIIQSIINISRGHSLTRNIDWRSHAVGEEIRRIAGGVYFRSNNFWSSGWVDDEWPDYITLGLTDVDVKVDLTLMVADITTQTQGGGTFSSSAQSKETLTQTEGTTISGSGEVSAGEKDKSGRKAGVGISHTTTSGRTLESTGQSGLSMNMPAVVYKATAVMRITVHYNPTLESIFTKTTDVEVGHVVFGAPAPAATPP